ncbi:MAG TPA: LLM class flavin-dependent oxidoreductase [Acidimicrobiia bacterium]|nr:LLM class flavin-dependent oxidoreductase [Acidimicrobiia bacterium]
MRVGVQLPEAERVVGWPEIRRMAVRIEESGFDSIWVGDHLLYEEEGIRSGPWEAFTQLAALAAVTSRVELGPLVAAQPFHEPAILAKQAATVDEISGGRLVLGLGAGWNRLEFDAFGLPYERRVSRFEEGFEIIRRLLAGETVTFHGEFYDLEECVLLPPSNRPGGPPLMIGSNSPRMLSIALPHVSAWNSWFTDFENDPDRLPPLLERIEEACERVGRQDVRKSVALWFQLEGGTGRSRSANPIQGDLSQMADALHRTAAAGIGEVQLVLDPIDEQSIDTMAGVLASFRT